MDLWNVYTCICEVHTDANVHVNLMYEANMVYESFYYKRTLWEEEYVAGLEKSSFVSKKGLIYLRVPIIINTQNSI